MGMMKVDKIQGESFALILGHPGHELRVFQTICRLKPIAYLLTDGSGGTGESRVESTRKTLEAIGISLVSPFPAPMRDADLYSALQTGNHAPLLAWTRALAEDLERRKIDTVIADAAEGFNPAHDLCRAIARTARKAAQVRHGYAYLLEGRPDACPEGRESDSVFIVGTPDEIAQKHKAIAAYPEIQYEVERAFATWGRAAFSRECLFVDDDPPETPPVEIPPAYERHGEARVKAGKYGEVLRYEQHIKPAIDALIREMSR